MRIEQIHTTLVVSANASLPLYAGPIMDQIRNRRRGRLVRPNLPDGAPAELPRLAVMFDDAVLQVGNSRIEFLARPPRHVAGSYASSIGFTMESAMQHYTELLGDLPEESLRFEWSGVIMTVNFPRFEGETAARAQPMSAIRDTADRLLHVDLAEDALELAGFDLKVGFHRDRHFVNYHFSEYAIKEAVMGPRGGTIDVDRLPTQELGIGLAIDVNSRPLAEDALREPIPDLQRTVEHHKRAFDGYAQFLGLEGPLR